MMVPYVCPVCGANILIYQLLNDNKGAREAVTYVCGKEMLIPVEFGKQACVSHDDPERHSTYPNVFPNGKFTISKAQPIKSVAVCGNAEKVIERMKK